MLPIGKLRQRVAIQPPTEARNAQGESTTTYATTETVWARVEPLDGREYANEAEPIGETRYRVTMRYYSGLTTKCRLLWGSLYLNIESIVNADGRNVEHILICKEAPA